MTSTATRIEKLFAARQERLARLARTIDRSTFVARCQAMVARAAGPDDGTPGYRRCRRVAEILAAAEQRAYLQSLA